MSDKIDIPINASGDDGINKVVSAIDRLYSSIEKLANASGVSKLQQQMAQMQASMTTGFAEMAANAQKGANATVQAIQTAATRMQAIEQKRDTELNAMRQRQNVDYVKFWEKQLATAEAGLQKDLAARADAYAKQQQMQQRRDVEQHNAAQAAAQRLVEIQQRRDTELHREAQAAASRLMEIQQRRDLEMYREAQIAASRLAEIQQRRDIELHREQQNAAARQHEIQQRRDIEEYRAAQTQAQRMIEIEQRRDMELHNMRQRAAADAAAQAEKQRLLNTQFQTAGPAAQLRMATQAQVYGGMGGNATERYGSAAATANITALQAAHDRLAASARTSAGSLANHNEMMREAHGLARGLAGSLGGLWLTYGSLVPLVAGAAIAASLKGVAQAGAEVEYQLKFVEALNGGGKGVSLDSLLHITDQTIVSVKDAAEGLRALAQNGLNAKESLQVLPSVLNLAVIGEMGVSQAALSATGAVSAFGLGLDNLDHVTQVFAQTAATSNTSVIAMTESMKQASTVASVYGSSLEETAAALGTLAKINITGGAAGTAFTNMLTNLYSPTQQATRAMQELGVSTNDGAGGLKGTTELLGELRLALSKYNATAQATLLADIFTVRGQKGASAILNNWQDYLDKVKEAEQVTNFTGTAVAKLEDSVHGAMARMGNSINSSFNQAFQNSSAPLQHLITEMGTLARSEGTVQILTAMADAAIRLTRFVMENATAIGLLVAGFVGLKIVTSTVIAFEAYFLGLQAARAAATTAAAANVTLATSIRGVMSALGVIGLAITAATVAWQLFIAETTEVEKADDRIRNSIHANIEMLERETDALNKRNEARNPGATVDPDKLPTSQQRVKDLEAELAAKKSRGFMGDTLSEGIVGALKNRNAIKATELKLDAARKDQWKETALAESLAIGLSTEAYEKERETVRKSIEALVEKGRVAKTIAGEQVAIDPLGNKKSREIALNADQIRKDLQDNKLSAAQAKIELAAAEQKYSAALQSRVAKPGRGAGAGGADDHSEISARVRELQGLLELQRLKSAADVANGESQNRRGELGDLQLINLEIAEKLKLNTLALDIAKQQRDVPGQKPHQMQGHQNKVNQAAQQIENDNAAGENKKKDLFSALAEEERAYNADMLREKGQFVEAFTSDYQAKYGIMLANLSRDIQAAEGTEYAGRLTQFQKHLADKEAAEKNSAKYKGEAFGFDLEMSKLQTKLQEISANDGPGTGLASIFENAKAAQDAYMQSLPQLEEMQKRLEATAKNGSPKEQADALSKLRAIRTEAAQMRNIWVGLASVIENSLTAAFGKAGTALGKLVNSTIAFGAKRKQIEDNFNKSDKGGDAQAARLRETTTAQVNAYAEMTGAAKGFFKEGTTGYTAMATAEKAFRMIEMGMALQAHLTKSGLLSAFTGLFVTSKATETAATVASVAPDVAASMVKGQAAAVAGVAGQAQGDPYTAWARMAAMAVVMGTLGFIVAGSGKKPTAGHSAEEVQKIQGSASFYDKNGKLNSKDLTGGVFGDAGAKSNSIKNSLDRMEKYSGDLVPINRGMLEALRAIEASMTGLANILVRTPGAINGENFGIQEGTVKRSGGSGMLGMTAASGAVIGGVMLGPVGALVGGVLGALAGKLASLWGKTTQNVVDSGIRFGGSVRGLQQGQGFSQYASVDVTKSSWFGLSKKTTNQVQSQGLSGELPSQIGQVFTDLEKALGAAAVSMGGRVEQVTTVLNGLKIDTSSISLKGLSGDALTQALQATISKAMDQMASAVFPSLDKFRQVGEGYAETVMRLASNYGVLDNALESIGGSFGATGVASLTARERLIELAGGIDAVAEQSKGFAENYLTEAERLAPVQKHVNAELARMGLTGLKTRDQFKAAVQGLANSGALTTESGAQMFTSLMALQEAFAKVTAPLEDLTKSIAEIASETKDLQEQLDELTLTRVELLAKERAQLDPSNRALFDQIQRAKKVVEAKERLNEAYENERDSIEETIDRLQGFNKSWLEFRDGLKMGDLSTFTPEQKYVEARSQFETTRVAALSGDTDAQGRYEEVARSFLQASREVNASGDGYTADFNMVLTTTEKAAQWAAAQVDVAKASLITMQTQLGALIEIKSAVLTVSEALYELRLAQADYNLNVPPPPPPPPAGGSGLSKVDLEAILAGIGSLQRTGEVGARAQVDATHAAAAEAAAAQRELERDRRMYREWDSNNRVNIR